MVSVKQEDGTIEHVLASCRQHIYVRGEVQLRGLIYGMPIVYASPTIAILRITRANSAGLSLVPGLKPPTTLFINEPLRQQRLIGMSGSAFYQILSGQYVNLA